MKPFSFFIKILFITFCTSTLFAVEYPKLYAQLATPLFEQAEDFNALKKLSIFQEEHSLIQAYEKEVNETLLKGISAESSNETKTKKAYLKSLRRLQNSHDKIEKLYKQKLYKSIYDKNTKIFYSLMEVPLTFIQSDARLKKAVVLFYEKTKKTSHSYLTRLSQDYDLDESSYAYLDKMFQMTQEKQKVQSRQALKDFSPDETMKKPVKVVSLRTKNGFDLYVENNAYYTVTVKLEGRRLVNVQSSQRLPYINSYPPRSRSKVLSLSIIDPHKASSFQTLYSTMIGGLSSHYNKNYIYALPYKRGQGHLLSQGFNGAYTHKGNSAYALDFTMPVGTSVHAMRDGIVTAVESKNTEHGFSIEYANKSNYVIIEHEDGTMAMYGHLDTNGVRVKLGQRVYKHQFIALSGNTGYSSGPHLHVHITAIQNYTAGSRSIPFIFMSKRGRIETAVENSIYTAH